MTNGVIYTFSSGEDVKLKLGMERITELEDKLGDSIAKKLAEIEKASIAVEFIAAAIPDGDYADRKKTACAIYDDMCNAGKNYRDYMYLIFEILTKAGFIEGGTVEKQKQLQAEQDKLTAAVHKAELALISQKTEEISKTAAPAAASTETTTETSTENLTASQS